jgi:hypothetical protein
MKIELQKGNCRVGSDFQILREHRQINQRKHAGQGVEKLLFKWKDNEMRCPLVALSPLSLVYARSRGGLVYIARRTETVVVVVLFCCFSKIKNGMKPRQRSSAGPGGRGTMEFFKTTTACVNCVRGTAHWRASAIISCATAHGSFVCLLELPMVFVAYVDSSRLRLRYIYVRCFRL